MAGTWGSSVCTSQGGPEEPKPEPGLKFLSCFSASEEIRLNCPPLTVSERTDRETSPKQLFREVNEPESNIHAYFPHIPQR